jgi:hypothetical protein
MARHPAVVVVLVTFVAVLLSTPLSWSAPPEDKRTADEIVAAAKKAGEAGEKVAKAVRAGDEATAKSMIGADINVGGEPMQRSKEQWTIKCVWGITVVATKINAEADPKVELEGNTCCAWGRLKSVDMATKTITLENVELIYVEKMNWPKEK